MRYKSDADVGSYNRREESGQIDDTQDSFRNKRMILTTSGMKRGDPTKDSHRDFSNTFLIVL